MIWKIGLVAVLIGIGALAFVLSKEVPAPTQDIAKTLDSKTLMKN